MAMHRVVIGESASYPTIAKLFFETGPGRTIDAVAAFLEAEMSRRGLKRDDPGYVAVLFLNIVRAHYQLQLLMSMTPDLKEEDVDRHVHKVVGQSLTLYGTSGNRQGRQRQRSAAIRRRRPEQPRGIETR